MPDTSKMSAEAYAAFIGNKAYPSGQKEPSGGQCVRCGKSTERAYQSHFFCEEHWPFTAIASMQEYARKIEASAEQDAKSQGESMSEPGIDEIEKMREEIWKDAGVPKDDPRRQKQFTPGQTVFGPLGEKVVVVAHDGDDVWGREGGRNMFWTAKFLKAVPNVKPLPQKCPFCDGPSATKSYGTSSYLVCCSLNEPCLVGPHKTTHEEAVAVWNRIRVIQPGEFTNDLRDALRKAADDCKFKTTLKE